MKEEEKQKVNDEFNSKASTMSENDLQDISAKRSKVFSLLEKIGEKASDIKLLWSLMMDYKNGKYKEVPWKLISAIVFAFVYLVSPLDVIPDVIPVLGLTDDASVFGLVIAGFASDIEKYKNWQETHSIGSGN